MIANRMRKASLGLLPFALLVAGAPAFAARSQSSYAYVRTLEGTASLYGVDAGYDRDDSYLSVNSPLRSGDRIRVDRGSRAELVLPDQSVLRLDGGADLTLSVLALAADRDSETSRIQLQRGEIQLVVLSSRYGANLPRIDTPNSTIYLDSEGAYRVATDGARTTEVIVRQGRAEVVTVRGSATVRGDELLIVSGTDWPQLEVDDAGQETALERWGRRLDDEVVAADLRDIDEPLRYGAGRLTAYGSWVSVGNRRAWRPSRVSAGWRPYVDGRWTYTPSGLTWVSNEPWGWSTYHYGTWDYVPGYGWAWFPGSRYSPAWVYWYWGPTYTGWCPVGYYSRYYSFGASLRFGVYGWAGGSWGAMADWTFCPTRSLRNRNLRDNCGRGRDFAGRGVLDRGLVTTDTRGVTPDLFDRPQDIVTRLHRGALRGRPGAAGAGSTDLPDVNDFVARRRDLPVDLARGVSGADGQGLLSGGREPWPAPPAGRAGPDTPDADHRAVRRNDRGRDAGVDGSNGSGREPWVVDRRSGGDGTMNRPVEPQVRDRRQGTGANADGGRREPDQVPVTDARSRGSRQVIVDGGREPASNWRDRDRGVTRQDTSRGPAEPTVRGGNDGGNPGAEPVYRRSEPQPRAVDRDDSPARRVVDGVRSSRVRSNPEPQAAPPTAAEPPSRRQNDSGREPARQRDSGRSRSGGNRGGGGSGADSGRSSDPPRGG